MIYPEQLIEKILCATLEDFVAGDLMGQITRELTEAIKARGPIDIHPDGGFMFMERPNDDH